MAVVVWGEEKEGRAGKVSLTVVLCCVACSA